MEKAEDAVYFEQDEEQKERREREEAGEPLGRNNHGHWSLQEMGTTATVVPGASG